MARLAGLLTVLFLSIWPALAGTTWFVRTTGSDANCDGTTGDPDDGVGGDTTCALRTIQFAMTGTSALHATPFTCSLGDDLNIGAGTFSEAVAFPTSCRCPSSDRCVIDGAGRDPATGTVVNPGTGAAAFTYGHVASASAHQYISFTDMNAKGGTSAAFLCGPAKYCQFTRITNVLIDGITQIPLNAGPKATVVFDAAINNTSAPYDNNVLENVIINGDDTFCRNSPEQTFGRVCGSNTGAIYGNAFGTIVKDSYIRNFQGHAARLAGHGMFDNVWVEHVWGGEDDGVVQCYNANDCIIYDSTFFHVHAVNSDFGVVKIRATTTERPSMAVVNSTFIAEPTTCTGVVGGPTCLPDQYTGADNVTRQGGAVSTQTLRGVARIQPNSSATTGPFPYFYFNHNIVKGYNCTPNCYGVYAPGGGSTATSACPVIFELSGNIYDTVTDPINTNCTSTRYRYDVTETQTTSGISPTTAAPPAGSVACVPGGLGFTSSWDPNIVSHVYAGSQQGGCSATAPDCGNASKEGYEDCDGAAFGGVGCATLGFASGAIACTADCKYNTAGCVAGTPAFVRAGTNVAGVQTEVVMGAAPAANNTLILCSSRRAGNSPGVTSVTQQNVTWTAIRPTTSFNNEKLDFWYGVAGANAGATITVLGESGTTALTVLEFSGLRTTSPIDVSNSTGAAAASSLLTPVIPTTGTLAESNEVAIACFGQADTDGSVVWSLPQESYTLEAGAQKSQGSGGTGASSAVTYKLLGSSASTFTGLTSSQIKINARAIATFKRPSLSAASTPFCTNYIKESGESCDLTELDGATCVSLGHTGGTLACSGTCAFDTTNCVGGSGCTNTVQDGTETDVDCGGNACPDCPDGDTCAADTDCISNRCVATVCRSCTDGITTAPETDTDCGGGVCPGCADGETCAIDSDCSSNLCVATVCTANPTCVDGIANGGETDVDCGGATACPRCEDTSDCAADSDCNSGRCDSLVCRSCFDNVQSGAESDVDCGGDGCVACANGKACTTAANCASNFCSPALVCAPAPVGANCTNAAQDGNETDVDCGGGTCPDCPAGDSCVLASDCLTNRCESLVCRSCSDTLKTGSETDVDCGGGSATGCQACAVTKACTVATDCLSGRCESSVCRSCTDGVKSGTETDVDCGGTCPACAAGRACLADADCLNGSCTNGVCSSQGVVTSPSAPSRTVTVWTVRTDGNDENCKGSKDAAYTGKGKGSNCAFKTLGKAVAVARCGDTVSVAAGTHSTTTQTATASCVDCPGGIYSFDTMGVINSKACSANTVLTVRGERGADGSYRSILDGGGTIEQALKVQNSASVVVRDLKFQNFIGTDPNIINGPEIGIIGVSGSDHITLTRNRVTNLTSNAFNGGELFVQDSSAITVSQNYVMSSHPFISFFRNASGDVIGNHIFRDNTILRSGFIGSHPQAGHLFVTTTRGMQIKGNYFGKTSTTAGSVNEYYGVRYQNARDVVFQGNIFEDLPVTDEEAYLFATGGAGGCTGSMCNDKTIISNNTFHKASAHATTTFIRLVDFAFGFLNGSTCKGTQVFNNVFVADVSASTDTAINIFCDGDDATGVQDARADYNFFSNIAKPMVYAGANWTCPSLACTSHTTKDEHASVHDAHNTADSGLQLSGFAPWPYFGLKAGATALNVALNDFCWIAPDDGLCDMGAFERGGGPGSGLPPGKAPSITIPTSAGVN